MPTFPDFEPAAGVAQSQQMMWSNMFDRVARRKAEAIQLQQEGVRFAQDTAFNELKLQEARIAVNNQQSQLDQARKINDLRISEMKAAERDRERIHGLRKNWSTMGQASLMSDLAYARSQSFEEQQKLIPMLQAKYAPFFELPDVRETVNNAFANVGGESLQAFRQHKIASDVQQASLVASQERLGNVFSSREELFTTKGAVRHTVAKGADGKVYFVADPTGAVDPTSDAKAQLAIRMALAAVANDGPGPDGRPAKIDFNALMANPDVAAVVAVPGSKAGMMLDKLMQTQSRASVPRQKSAMTIEAEAANQELSVVANDLRAMLRDPKVVEEIRGRVGPVDDKIARLGDATGMWAQSKNVNKFTQRFAAVRNVILKLRSGGAVTDGEAARFMEELGSLSGNDENFLQRFETFLGDLERTVQSKLQSFGAADAANPALNPPPGVTVISTNDLDL